MAYTVFLTVASLLPSRAIAPLTPRFFEADKIGHFGVYGIYALLLLWAVPHKLGRRVWRVLGVVCYCGLFGLLMEVLQGALHSATRTCSPADATANLAGAIAFAVVGGRYVNNHSTTQTQQEG